MHRQTRWAQIALASLSLLFASACGGPRAGLSSGPNAPIFRTTFSDIASDSGPVAPIRLTASDGSGLALVSVAASAVVDDPLAFTELRLVFENPEDRVREGTFSIVLPEGAAISRFAMKQDTSMVLEGEVVERQQARVAYEDFLHRKQDPALLEQSAGNEFSARVFPIPARAKKEIIVSYSQEITAQIPYRLPLKGLGPLGALDIEIYKAGRAAPAQTIRKKDITPDADVALDAAAFSQRSALRHKNLVALRVKPPAAPLSAQAPEPLARTLVLLDTSASRALGAAEQGRLLDRLAKAISKLPAEESHLTVVAYDQIVSPVFDGPAAEFGQGALSALTQRLSLGASSLDSALQAAATHANANRLSRVILVTDGIPTAGATDGETLRSRVKALQNAGVTRLDAIAMGGIRDTDLLKSLVNAGLPRGGAVIDGKAPEAEMLRRLTEATSYGVSVKVENASFVFPATLDGVQAGDEALVFANVPEDKPIRVAVGGGAWESPEVAQVEKPLIERAWAGAKIRSLLEMERTKGRSEALSKEIVALSTQYRVLSPLTGLLVLESDHDYARFGIDPRAAANILTVSGGHVTVVKRPQALTPKAIELPAPKPTPTTAGTASPWSALGSDPLSARGSMWGDEVGDAFGAGGVGLSGSGEGGGGRSEGIGLGQIGTLGHGTTAGSPPQRTTGQAPSLPPSLDPNVVVAPSAASRPPTPNAGIRAAANPEPGSAVAPPHRRSQIPTLEAPATAPRIDAYTGTFREVMRRIDEQDLTSAMDAAFAWHKKDPGDAMALVALGEVFERAGQSTQAARAYGSLIDLFPSRADMRRFAGARLERLRTAGADALATDTFEKALALRPDHPSSHRLYAFALLKRGDPEKAFEVLARGLRTEYPDGRFRDVSRVLSEDLGLIAAAWIKKDPSQKSAILKRVRDEGGLIEDEPSLRFVLTWETDANDVDFHIFDRGNNHAYFKDPTLVSGGRLYADVTTGYGPECFTIRGRPEDRFGPYTLQANYFSRGPMGFGMGKVQVIEHDGNGGLTFSERPFVVMADRAFVDLGTVAR